MRNKTWLVPFLVIGVIALVTVGCQATGLLPTIGQEPARSSLAEIAPLVGAGTPVALSGERITAENGDRMTLLARVGNGVIPRQVAWSPNGRTLAFPSSYGIYLFDAETLAQIRFIEEPAQRDRDALPVRICPAPISCASLGES